MNESSTIQDSAVAEPAQQSISAVTEFLNTTSTHPPHHEGGTTFSADIAQKVMRLTGGIRLTSRSAHTWHHCGINE